MEMWY